MYGKLIDGSLVSAPNYLQEGGRTIYHPTPEMLEANGWLPIIRTDPPDQDDETNVKVYAPSWVEQDGQIVQVWTEADAPTEPEDTVPTQDERIAALEMDNAALKEALDMLLSGVTEDA